jgi:hypothetical protein
MGKRSYGSGQLFVRADGNGRETYYGSWRVGGRRVTSSRSSASSVASPSAEMWRAASLAIVQRLWLTTSTLCPSGSRTKAP